MSGRVKRLTMVRGVLEGTERDRARKVDRGSVEDVK